MSEMTAQLVVSMEDKASSPISGLISTVSKLTSSVTALSKSVSGINTGLAKTSVEVAKAPSGWAKLGQTLTGLKAQAVSVRSTFNDVGNSVKSLGLSMAAVAGGAGYLFKTQFIDTSAQFEGFSAQLKTLYGDDGPKMMSWVKDFATKTPTDVAGVMDAFTQLKIFGIDPTNGSLMSLVDSVSRAGFSQEKLMGTVASLGQAWTKNRLGSEEFRELSSKGVGALDLLAGVMGKSTDEVVKLAEAGKLGRKHITLLIDSMGKQASGAAEEQMKTWSGLVSNLGDSWTQFKLSIMDAGPFKFLKGKLGELLDTINKMTTNGQLQQLAERIGGGITEGFKYLWDNKQNVINAVVDIGNSIKGAVKAVGGLRNAAIIAGIALSSGLIVNLGRAAVAFVQFGWALLANPVGVVVIAIAGLIAITYALYTNWDRIFGFLGRKLNEFSALSTKAKFVVVAALTAMAFPLLPFIAFLTPVIAGTAAIAGAAKLITDGWEPVDTFFANMWTGLKNGVNIAIAKIKELINLVGDSTLGKVLGTVLDYGTKHIQFGAGLVGEAASYYWGAAKEAGAGLGITSDLSTSDAYGVNAIAMRNKALIDSVVLKSGAPIPLTKQDAGQTVAQSLGLGAGQKLGNIDINVNLSSGKATVSNLTAGKAVDLDVNVGQGMSLFPPGVTL